ncbi:MAG: hypothetical protein JO142_05965 [Burkholderiales bacterium]|nr:hypothetical protein [Burkholderiales bacterium]
MHPSTEGVAVISGATTAPGQSAARAFAAMGYSVVVSGRDRVAGRAVASAIESAGGRAEFVDAARLGIVPVNDLLQIARARFGPVSIFLSYDETGQA